MSGIAMSMAAFAIVVMLALGVGEVAQAAVDAAQASSAADAAALAGAMEGRNAAAEVAALNGAEVVIAQADGFIFRAVVRVGDAEAEAFAERVLLPLTTP